MGKAADPLGGSGKSLSIGTLTGEKNLAPKEDSAWLDKAKVALQIGVEGEVFGAETVRLALEHIADGGTLTGAAARLGCRVSVLARAVALYAEEGALERAQFARKLCMAERALELTFGAAELDPAEIFDKDGNIKPLKDIPVETRRRISKMKAIEGGTVDFSFLTPDKAVELLGREGGIFQKKTEISMSLSLEAAANIKNSFPVKKREGGVISVDGKVVGGKE